MPDFLKVLTGSDIILCAIAAFFAAHLVRFISTLRKLLKEETRFINNPSEFSKAMEKCYALFPLEIIKFKGETFRRGINVRIKTVSSKIIEGMFVGMNDDNVVCVITRTYISAEILDNISEITVIDKN